MGQQQLLLIVLGGIIVGIAVVVGIQMFSSSAEQNNIDQTSLELLRIINKAQEYYAKPEAMGGGGKSFVGFSIRTGDDTTENAYYRITETDAQKMELSATCRIAEGVRISATVYPTSHTLKVKRKGTGNL